MSEAQAATPEQQERMQTAVAEAQQRAMQEVQQNAQIEIQMRSNSLSLAVEAHKKSIEYVNGTAEEIAKTATVFLKFLKQGEA
jgi:vacuolar-type H+-ATPase subunit E/Vma4